MICEARIRRVFDVFDYNKKGFITLDELERLLRAFGLADASKTVVAGFMRTTVSTGSSVNEVSFEETKRLLQQNYTSGNTEEIWLVYKLLDKVSRGRLNAQDLIIAAKKTNCFDNYMKPAEEYDPFYFCKSSTKSEAVEADSTQSGRALNSNGLGALSGATGLPGAGGLALAGLGALSGATGIPGAGSLASAGLGTLSGATGIPGADSLASTGLGALSGATGLPGAGGLALAGLGALSGATGIPGADSLASTGLGALSGTIGLFGASKKKVVTNGEADGVIENKLENKEGIAAANNEEEIPLFRSFAKPDNLPTWIPLPPPGTIKKQNKFQKFIEVAAEYPDKGVTFEEWRKVQIKVHEAQEEQEAAAAAASGALKSRASITNLSHSMHSYSGEEGQAQASSRNVLGLSQRPVANEEL